MNSLGDRYSAIVIGSSGGLGSAFVSVLRADVHCRDVSALSRRDGALDITDEASVKAAADRLASQEATFDILICATGGLIIGSDLPEKTIRSLSADAMARQFALNAIGPALVIKHFSPLMSRNRRVLLAFLSARVGSIGDNRLGGWISYRASKAALNQIIRTSSIELSRQNPQSVLVALHPGTVETSLSEPFSKGKLRLSPEASASAMLGVLDELAVTQTGGFFGYDGSRIEW